MTLTPSRAAILPQGAGSSSTPLKRSRDGADRLLVGYGFYGLLIAVFPGLPLVPQVTPAAGRRRGEPEVMGTLARRAPLSGWPRHYCSGGSSGRGSARYSTNFYGRFNCAGSMPPHTGYTWVISKLLRVSASGRDRVHRKLLAARCLCIRSHAERVPRPAAGSGLCCSFPSSSRMRHRPSAPLAVVKRHRRASSTLHSRRRPRSPSAGSHSYWAQPGQTLAPCS